MLDSFKVKLCNEKTPRVHVFVNAEVCNGCLKISGQDIGVACDEAWGDNEYEYYYDFSEADTERLFSLLCTEGITPSQALITHFSGIDGCKRLRSFCEENSIKYSIFSC